MPLKRKYLICSKKLTRTRHEEERSRSRTENSFLGYAVKENGLLDTNIKGGFGIKSDWPHLNHLAQKVDAKIQWEFSEQRDLMSTINAQVILTVDTTTKVIIGKTIRKEFLESQLIANSNKLKPLPMQGWLYDIDRTDYLLSQNIYRNFCLSDNLVQFWYRARQNVLPCNYTLSHWYTNKNSTYSLDGYYLESMSQVLNGCRKFSNNYSKRHDRVVEKIAEELTTSDTEIYVNKLFSTTFPEFKKTIRYHSETGYRHLDRK